MYTILCYPNDGSTNTPAMGAYGSLSRANKAWNGDTGKRWHDSMLAQYPDAVFVRKHVREVRRKLRHHSAKLTAPIKPTTGHVPMDGMTARKGKIGDKSFRMRSAFDIAKVSHVRGFPVCESRRALKCAE